MAAQAWSLERLSTRVGDDDRDAVAADLLSHHLNGRLSLEELERREAATRDAVTTADLVRLLVDLPGGGAALLGPAVPPARRGPVLSPVVRDRLVRFGTAPAVVTVGAWKFSVSGWQFNSDDVFFYTLLNGALGILAHSWASRRKRRQR